MPQPFPPIPIRTAWPCCSHHSWLDLGKLIRCPLSQAFAMGTQMPSMWPGKPWWPEAATTGHIPRSRTKKYAERGQNEERALKACEAGGGREVTPVPNSSPAAMSPTNTASAWSSRALHVVTAQGPFGKTPFCTRARLKGLLLLATKLSLSKIITHMQGSDAKIRKVRIKFFLLCWCYEVIKQSGTRNRGSSCC